MKLSGEQRLVEILKKLLGELLFERWVILNGWKGTIKGVGGGGVQSLGQTGYLPTVCQWLRYFACMNIISHLEECYD